MDAQDPRDDLAAIAQANREMARRAMAPAWYHYALGALVGALVAAQELRPLYSLAVLPFFFLGLLGLMNAYRRHTGMWISGYRHGRTRPVALGLAVILAPMPLLVDWLKEMTHIAGVGVLLGLVVAAVVTTFGYLWEAAYRRDLGVRKL